MVNPPLTELGHAQADRLAKSLVDEAFDELYVSPLVRARQTAAPVWDVLGRPEVVEDWLEEIRDPEWHGSPGRAVGQGVSASCANGRRSDCGTASTAASG